MAARRASLSRGAAVALLAGAALILAEAPARAIWPYSGAGVQPVSAITVTNATAIGTSGGNVVVNGTGFAQPTIQFSLNGTGPWIACATSGTACMLTSNSSSTQIVVNFPGEAAGFYDALVSNNDGSTKYAPKLLQVFTETTPIACVSSVGARYWVRGDSDANTGCGTASTSWTDKSGTQSTGITLNSVIHECGNSDFQSQPFWLIGGSPSSAQFASSTFSLSTNTIWVAAAVRLLAAGSNPTIWTYAGGKAQMQGSASTGIPTIGSTPATWTSSIVGSSVDLIGYVHGTGSSSETNALNVNLQPYVTSTGAIGEPPTTGNFYIGTDGSNYADMELSDLVVFDGVPTTPEQQCVGQYMNLRYGLSSPPVYTASTILGGTTSTAQSLRITGANFVPGMSVSLQRSGTSFCNCASTATCTYVSSSIEDVQCPSGAITAGSADIVLTNPDLGQSTNPGAATVSATPSPMQIFGTAEKLYADSQYVTTSSGNIATWLDESLRGNTVSTSNNVAYTSSDATFLGLPSGTWNGSNSYAYASAVNGVAGTDAILIWAVFKISTAVAGGMIAQYTGTDTLRFDQRSAGVPGIFFNGLGTSWSTSVTGAHLCWVYETGGSSWTQGVNCDNGTTVTASQSGTGLGPTGQFTMGNFATDTGSLVLNGKIVAEGLVDFGSSGTAASAQVNDLCYWASQKYGTSGTNCPTVE